MNNNIYGTNIGEFDASLDGETTGQDVVDSNDPPPLDDNFFSLEDASYSIPVITQRLLGSTSGDETLELLRSSVSNFELPLASQALNDIADFQVIGTKIYDPNGQEFIAKGVNVFTWDGTDNIDNYIDTWGFNTVRIPNYLLGGYGQPHPADDGYATNRAIVDAYTDKGAVVVFDAHDRIGSYYEGEELEMLKDYWRTMAQEFKDNPYVWFNLHNEPGNASAQPEKWVSYHRELIDIIRAEGAQNTIVVDGETWGQDYQTRTILNKAGEVMEGNENIMFSLHIYDQWTDGSEIGGYIDQLHAENIPVMIGEYGDYPAAEQMMQAVQEREVGRVAWVAMANDLNDFTTETGGHAWHYDGTNPDILTDFGALALEDLQRSEDLEQLNPTPHESLQQISLESGQTIFKETKSVTVLGEQDDRVMGLDDWNDVIRGKEGNDVLRGLGGNDTLKGGRGDDHLFGDTGNDRLVGGHGNDLLVGYRGDDLLKGGRGNDLFWLDVDSGIDTILDFVVGEDRILLAQGLDIEALEFVQGVGEFSEDTLIQLAADQQILGVLANTAVDAVLSAVLI